MNGYFDNPLRLEAGLQGWTPQIRSKNSQEKNVRSAPETGKGREAMSFGCEDLGEWKDAREGGGGRDVRIKTFNGNFQVNCHVLCDKLILTPQ